MYWNTQTSIDGAAMDGSQHRCLVNQTNNVVGITVDSEGTLHNKTFQKKNTS